MRRPIPSSPHRPACRASLSLFPVLLLLLPQSESAIAGARSRAGKVRNTFSAFSPSGAIKRPETPMQQPPTEIRDRLLTGLDQDYNVSSPLTPRDTCGPSARALSAAPWRPPRDGGPSRGTRRVPPDPSESPKVSPGAPEAPWRPHDLGVLGSFFGVTSSWCKVFEFVRLVLSPRDCCSGRLRGRDERRGRPRLDQSQERRADGGDGPRLAVQCDVDSGGGGGVGGGGRVL